ncbi:MAG: MFS transporter [Lachnospiraceae bacterium]|nr:MFS transporter [Lachnospiraceae bacterium]
MKLLHKKLERNIIYDYFYTFINNLNMSSSIWVLYLAYHGMSLMKIGILEGIYHITGIIFEIPSGAIADLLGRKKSLLLGRILMVISCFFMLFSASFIGFAVGFILQSLSGNFNSGAEEALVFDSLKMLGKENSYTAINGRINMLIEVSQSIATVVGGILAEISYTYCYGACIIITLIGILPALFMTEPPVAANADDDADNIVKEKKRFTNVVRGHFTTSAKVLKANPKILFIIIYYSVIFSSFALLFFYSQQYFSDFGLNKIEISLIMLFAGIVACAGAFLSDRIYRFLGNRISIIGAIAIAICIGLFGLNNLYVAFVALLIADFFNSVLYPIQSTSLNKLIPSEQRATLLSVNSMFFSVFMILLFPLAGALADVIGLGSSFVMISAVVLIGTCVLYKLSDD